MKLKNLKLFGLVKEYEFLFDVLFDKISAFYDACIENTPLDYRGNSPLVYWVQHITNLLNLCTCMREIRYFQDLYILNLVDNSIVVYDPKDTRFIDSSQLLFSFLSHLSAGWQSIPFLAGELKLNSRYLWGDLENQLIFFWVDISPVMDEILKILYSWHRDLFLWGFFISERKLEFYTVSYITPIFVESTRFKKFIYGSRDFWTEVVVKWLFIYEEPVASLDTGFRQKIEYKYRIQDLDRKEAIEFVLREILFELDIKTLRFLAGNGIINLNNLRKLGPQYF